MITQWDCLLSCQPSYLHHSHDHSVGLPAVYLSTTVSSKGNPDSDWSWGAEERIETVRCGSSGALFPVVVKYVLYLLSKIVVLCSTCSELPEQAPSLGSVCITTQINNTQSFGRLPCCVRRVTPKLLHVSLVVFLSAV